MEKYRSSEISRKNLINRRFYLIYQMINVDQNDGQTHNSAPTTNTA